MNDDYISLQDFKNLLILKNQLITLSSQELNDIYKDIDYYYTFIFTLVDLINTENAFLLFLDDIKKIQKIISLHRFDLDSDMRDIVNQIIVYLNMIDSFSDKKNNILKNGYILYQSKIRGKRFKNEEELLNYISFDAVLLYGLETDNLDIIDDDNRFLSSAYYFLEVEPELFSEEFSLDMIDKRLAEINNNIFNYRSKKKLQLLKDSFVRSKKEA